MLEELFNLVKGSASESVINNPDVPNEQNNEVVAEATNTVASGLRNMVAGGGLQNIISLLGGKDNNQQQGNGGIMNNPIISMMIGHFAGKLMSKFKMDGQQANNVASNLIPNVISNMINKTNDPNDSSFSLEKLLKSITGGQSEQVVQEQQQTTGNAGFNLSDLISQFTGGQQNSGSGGGGLMDIVAKLAGGAQAQQQQNGGGGLMDIIKGFIK